MPIIVPFVFLVLAPGVAAGGTPATATPDGRRPDRKCGEPSWRFAPPALRSASASRLGGTPLQFAKPLGEMSPRLNRLLETVRPRAIDLRPRLARALDKLSTLHDPNGANGLVEIALRVEAWTRHHFAAVGPVLAAGSTSHRFGSTRPTST